MAKECEGVVEEWVGGVGGVAGVGSVVQKWGLTGAEGRN